MKKIIAIIISVVMLISFCACNRRGIVLDLRNQANWAEIKHLNGEVYIYEVDSWSQDEEGYTIKTTDGEVLFVNGVNCILYKNKPDEKFGTFVE